MQSNDESDDCYLRDANVTLAAVLMIAGLLFRPLCLAAWVYARRQRIRIDRGLLSPGGRHALVTIEWCSVIVLWVAVLMILFVTALNA